MAIDRPVHTAETEGGATGPAVAPTLPLLFIALAAITVILSACGDSPPPTPEPTAAATATPSPEPADTATPEPDPPTPEPTAAATATPSPEPTATAILEPDPPTPEPTAAATATPGPEPAATATPEPARPASVTVSPAAVELAALGETAKLSVEVRDRDSTEVTGVAVTWTTSASSVAMVDALGVVTAVGSGTATITASAGSASGSAAVTVTQEVASVKVSPSVTGLTAWGETVQLAAEALDANGHPVAGADLSWESSGALVAEVDALGVVTAVGSGTATITASAGSASGSAVVTVTQEVASVEVSPSVTELTAWGETVQLAAEALDANGHPVAGTEFSWKSSGALVAEVDALGLVSGIGKGKATITASAGAASGSAVVAVPPTFTLSGTVRDSRENGPVLAGAVVRLESGKRGESMVIGPDGLYRFHSVWGTVTVRVIAWPTHGAETIEIAMGEDRTLDFTLEHTGTPPFAVTSDSPRVIETSDPTRLGSITYAGRGERSVWDYRPETWITINAYLFDVRYAGQVVEFRVNPEFGSREAAQAEVERFAHALGQVPAVLMPGIKDVAVHAGWARWTGGGGSITVHTVGESRYFEEAFVHEGTHVTLDPAHRDSPGWRAAQEADGVFISNYARDNPDREDVAESFLAWFAVRYQSERLSAAKRVMILRTIPNRLLYFDGQGFDMSPYTPSEVQYPSGEIVTIQGRVLGPDDRPVEAAFLRAWPDGADTFVDNVGTATTGEDGSFAIVVPNGSFILDVFAPGVSTESKEGCTFVGWHGPGGFTTVREDATRFQVDGESILDIVIRLPDHPDALPRIEWCA